MAGLLPHAEGLRGGLGVPLKRTEVARSRQCGLGLAQGARLPLAVREAWWRSLAACLDTHQEDQAVQEERVEEANGARHLVGENQSPLGSNKVWRGGGAGLTHPWRAAPGSCREGPTAERAAVSHCVAWEFGPQKC